MAGASSARLLIRVLTRVLVVGSSYQFLPTSIAATHTASTARCGFPAPILRPRHLLERLRLSALLLPGLAGAIVLYSAANWRALRDARGTGAAAVVGISADRYAPPAPRNTTDASRWLTQ
jgi:hypothetical protein